MIMQQEGLEEDGEILSMIIALSFIIPLRSFSLACSVIYFRNPKVVVANAPR